MWLSTIEILNISDVTSLTPKKENTEIESKEIKKVKQKKFSSAQNTEIQIRDKNPQFFHNNDHTIFKPKKENYFPAKKGKLKRIALKSYKKQIELKSEVNETDSEELDEDYQKWLMKILLTGVLIFMLVGGFYGYLVFAAFNSVPLWGSFIVVSLLFIGTALGFAFLWKGKPKGINGFWKYFAAWLTVFTLILVLSILYLALTFSVGGGF